MHVAAGMRQWDVSGLSHAPHLCVEVVKNAHFCVFALVSDAGLDTSMQPSPSSAQEGGEREGGNRSRRRSRRPHAVDNCLPIELSCEGRVR